MLANLRELVDPGRHLGRVDVTGFPYQVAGLVGITCNGRTDCQVKPGRCRLGVGCGDGVSHQRGRGDTVRSDGKGVQEQGELTRVACTCACTERSPGSACPTGRPSDSSRFRSKGLERLTTRPTIAVLPVPADPVTTCRPGCPECTQTTTWFTSAARPVNQECSSGSAPPRGPGVMCIQRISRAAPSLLPHQAQRGRALGDPGRTRPLRCRRSALPS